MVYILVALLFLIPPKELPERNHRNPETLPRYFHRVDKGKSLSKLIDHRDSTGFFIQAVRSDRAKNDTLKIYIQGVIKEKVPPNRELASKADLVIWCYPNEYPHSKHVFPNAEGRVYLREKNSTIIVLPSKDYVSP